MVEYIFQVSRFSMRGRRSLCTLIIVFPYEPIAWKGPKCSKRNFSLVNLVVIITKMKFLKEKVDSL